MTEGELGTNELVCPRHKVSLLLDGESVETELSGKVGVGVDVTESLKSMVKLSFITDEDDNGYGTKVEH